MNGPLTKLSRARLDSVTKIWQTRTDEGCPLQIYNRQTTSSNLFPAVGYVHDWVAKDALRESTICYDTIEAGIKSASLTSVRSSDATESRDAPHLPDGTSYLIICLICTTIVPSASALGVGATRRLVGWTRFTSTGRSITTHEATIRRARFGTQSRKCALPCFAVRRGRCTSVQSMAANPG